MVLYRRWNSGYLMRSKKATVCLIKCYVLLTVCLAATLSFAAKAGAAPVEIRFLTYSGLSFQDTWEMLVKEFNNSQKDVRVKLDYGGTDAAIRQKYLIQVAGGQAPDIVWSQDTSMFAAQGMLLPIDDFLKRDGIDRNDFLRAGLERGTYQGKLYGLPFGLNTAWAVYFNKRLFDDFGLLKPQDGWKWSDFLAVAKKLTRDTSGDGKPDVWGFDMVRWLLSPWLYTNGSGEFDVSSCRFIPDEERAVECLEWVVDLLNKHKVLPSSPKDLIKSFSDEYIGMMGEGNYASTAILGVTQGRQEFAFDAVHWPVNRSRVTIVGGYALHLSATGNVPRQEAAWKFVRWLVEPKQQIVMARGTSLLPSRGSILNSQEYKALLARLPGMYAFVKEIVEGRAIARPNPVGFGDLFGIMMRHASDALALKIPAQAAVAQMRRESDTYYEKIKVPIK